MKQEKTTPKPAKKKQTAKIPKNPATMRVCSTVLHHAPEVSAEISKNRPQKRPQQSHFRAVFHRDPSLPISVKIAFNSG